MKEDFILCMRGGINRQFEKLYLPKLDDGQISRVVLYECIDASARAKYSVSSVQIRRSVIEDRHQVLVQVNEDILIEFNLSNPKQAS